MPLPPLRTGRGAMARGVHDAGNLDSAQMPLAHTGRTGVEDGLSDYVACRRNPPFTVALSTFF